MTISNQTEHRMDCGEWGKVVDFYSGRLPESEMESIANHLSTCPVCETGLQHLQGRLAGDNFARDIRSCMIPDAPEPRESGLLVMEARALAITCSTTSAQFVPSVEHAPKTIGGYEIVGTIGFGGMGIVFRGRQHSLDRFVAIKMIRAGAYAGLQTFQRFFTEMQAISRLCHPNVVQLYHFGKHDDLPYFVMEWIDGGSLATKLTNGLLPLREAAEMIRTLAIAVEFAHRKNVIHRDLKPSNILLSADNTPKIADFGLAKLLDGAEELTVSDTVLGTPSYMAPEQAAGRRSEIGPATDVYALGAILYEAMTGKAPFLGENKIDTMRLVREKTPESPRKLRSEIPRDLDEICMKCLEKSPAKRYRSAQALAGDIHLWLNGKRPGQTPRLPLRLARVLRRNVALVSPMVLVSVVVIALLMRRPEQHPADPDKILREYESELAQGRAVSLIDANGNPKWFRWRAGEHSSKTTLAPNGTFRIYAPDTCLFELLPNPQSDHYRFAVKVRQDGSNPGKVGIYFARQAFSEERQAVEFFIRVTFDEIRGVLPAPKIKNATFVKVSTDLYSEKEGQIRLDETVGFGTGPSFQMSPADKTREHDLEVTVSPHGIRAEWDGQPFDVPETAIQKAIQRLIDQAAKSDPRVGAGIHPSFVLRGALGLYVYHGSASFSSASITPLLKSEK